MATPNFCCGGECGIVSPGSHWETSVGNAFFSTAAVRTGFLSIRVAPTAATASMVSCAITTTTFTWVLRCYIRFTTLPNNVVHIIGPNFSGTSPGIWFNNTGNELFLRGDNTGGPYSGIAVTTGVWYKIELRYTYNGTPARQLDGSINDVAFSQFTIGLNNPTTTTLLLGDATNSCTCDYSIDDLIVSNTDANYPLGAGAVYLYSPTADGTHNVAGTGDFRKRTAGTDITNATTDAYTCVDAGMAQDSDGVVLLAPPNATDYVEVKLTRTAGNTTVDPRIVEALHEYSSAATQSRNMEVRLKDPAGTQVIISQTGVAGVVAPSYARQKFILNSSAAAWTAADINDIRIQFGSPAAVDANPDTYFRATMLEVEIPDPPVIRTPRPTSIGHPFIF